MSAPNTKCSTCHCVLPIEAFFYHNEEHKTCSSCAIKRHKKWNTCVDCGIRAFFGYPDRKPSHCSKHYLVGMINTRCKRYCSVCDKLLNGETFSESPKYCKECYNAINENKDDDSSSSEDTSSIRSDSTSEIISDDEPVSDKKIGSRVCQYEGCNISASYGVKGTKTNTHCYKHGKSLGLANVATKMCEECGIVSASYGVKGTTKISHCSGCGKKRGLVNVASRKCQDCGKSAFYGREGTKKKTHCAGCGNKRGLVDVTTKMCDGCGKVKPSFGIEGTTRPTHCVRCKSEEMINILGKMCEDCGVVTACYGVEGTSQKTHCSSCGKKRGLVSLNLRLCEDCNLVSSSYGKEGTTRPSHCSSCGKKRGFVMIGKMCEGCNKKVPNFGKEGTTTATHCGSCGKKEGLINIKSKMCEKCNKVIASFGKEGTKQVTHCGRCGKKEGLVNITSKLCEECGILIASFGKEGTTKRTHCSSCGRKKGLVDISNKTCQDCHIKTPSYGLEGTTKRIYCSDCGKKRGLVNVMAKLCEDCNEKTASFGNEETKEVTHCAFCGRKRGYVNLVAKKCSFQGCSTSPRYLVLDSEFSYCSKHKIENSFPIGYKCRIKNCSNKARFGSGKTPLHCGEHKTLNDFDFLEKKCCNNECPNKNKVGRVNEEGKCIEFCCKNDNRYENVRLRSKTRENEMNKLLDLEIGIATAYDTGYKGGERPDRWHSIANGELFIECDENAGGKSYHNDENDVPRMIRISSKTDKNVFWIRLNPDAYKDSDGKRQNPPMSKRVFNVVKMFRYFSSLPDEYLKNISCEEHPLVVYLYYNGYEDSNSPHIYQLINGEKREVPLYKP